MNNIQKRIIGIILLCVPLLLVSFYILGFGYVAKYSRKINLEQILSPVYAIVAGIALIMPSYIGTRMIYASFDKHAKN